MSHFPAYGSWSWQTNAMLKGEVDRFRGLTLNVGDNFLPYRQRSYECGCREVIVARTRSRRHYFRVFSVYRNPDILDHFLLFIDEYG